MARILFLAQFLSPETFAGANRIGGIADALAGDHDVTVVTLRPSYPQASLYDESTTAELDASRRYRVRRTFHFVPHSRSLLVRGLREQRMAIRLAWAARREAADVVVTSSPSMFLGPAAWLLARRRRAPFVWDVRDVGWEYAGEAARPSGATRAALSLLRASMWSIARRADLVVAATAGIERTFWAHGIPAEKTAVVANSISAELVTALSGEHVETNVRPLVAYVGLLGEPQALTALVDAASTLPELDFIVAGDGPERVALAQRVRSLGVDNLVLAGYLPPPEVIRLYLRSDILFAQLKDTPTLNATAVPSKLFEYMAAAKPIVYAGGGLAADTVARVGCGLVVPAEDRTMIGDAIRTLAADPQRRSELGKRGRDFVERTASREHEAEAFAKELRDRLGIG